MNKFLLVFLLFSFVYLNGQDYGVTFDKSQKKYKPKSLRCSFPNFHSSIEFSKNSHCFGKIAKEEIHEFPIVFKKKTRKVGDIELFPIIFGRNKADSYGITVDNKYYEWGKRMNFISFSGDSIFYNDYSYNEKNLTRSLLCVLDENWKDTLFVKTFGEMHHHKIWYLNSFFYTPINDTVYNFKLKYSPVLEKSTYQDGMLRTESISIISTYHILNVGISKRYGFVWIKYSSNNNEYEIYYY